MQGAAEGREEEGIMEWKDACAQGFCQTCEHRDEEKADRTWENSETDGACAGGNTTCAPPGGADDAGCCCWGGGGLVTSWLTKPVEVVPDDKPGNTGWSCVFVVAVVLVEVECSWNSLRLLSLRWKGMRFPFRNLWWGWGDGGNGEGAHSVVVDGRWLSEEAVYDKEPVGADFRARCLRRFLFPAPVDRQEEAWYPVGVGDI